MFGAPLSCSKHRKKAYIENFDRGGSWGPQSFYAEFQSLVWMICLFSTKIIWAAANICYQKSWQSRFSGVHLVFKVFQNTWHSRQENPSAHWHATLSCPLMASNMQIRMSFRSRSDLGLDADHALDSLSHLVLQACISFCSVSDRSGAPLFLPCSHRNTLAHMDQSGWNIWKNAPQPAPAQIIHVPAPLTKNLLLKPGCSDNRLFQMNSAEFAQLPRR